MSVEQSNHDDDRSTVLVERDGVAVLATVDTDADDVDLLAALSELDRELDHSRAGVTPRSNRDQEIRADGGRDEATDDDVQDAVDDLRTDGGHVEPRRDDDLDGVPGPEDVVRAVENLEHQADDHVQYGDLLEYLLETSDVATQYVLKALLLAEYGGYIYRPTRTGVALTGLGTTSGGEWK